MRMRRPDSGELQERQTDTLFWVHAHFRKSVDAWVAGAPAAVH